MDGAWHFRALGEGRVVSSTRPHHRFIRLNTAQIEPEWIVWSHGLVPALTVASRMAGGEGDAVMVRRSFARFIYPSNSSHLPTYGPQTNTPIYPPFLWTPKTAGMATLQVPLKFDAGAGQWRMDFAKMEELVTPTTKMFTLCNPHNPVRRSVGCVA